MNGSSRRSSLGDLQSFVVNRCCCSIWDRDRSSLPDQFQRFSTLLRQRRESAHLSRNELGKRAGLSDRTIKNIEHALVSPSRDTVVRLLEVALGTSPRGRTSLVIR